MALDMNGATFGRNKTQINQLCQRYAMAISYLKNVLSGRGGGPDEYSSLMKTIDNYWAGADADKFKNDLVQKRSEIENKLDGYSKKIQEALNSSYEEFLRFQQR